MTLRRLVEDLSSREPVSEQHAADLALIKRFWPTLLTGTPVVVSETEPDTGIDLLTHERVRLPD